jgi:hypothetical protein
VIVDAVLLPAPPVIHAPPDTGICSGQTVLLATDSLSGVNWQWKVDGTNTGANHFELVTGIPGIYHVEISNACGTVLSVNSVEVLITGQIPDPPVISASGSTDLCSGEQVELSVPLMPGYDYEWKKDGQTTGTNTHTLTVDQDGVYHVIVSNLCGAATSSNSIVVALTYPPSASLILAGGPTEFCNGGNVQLSVSPQSGVSYFWFSDSIPFGINQPYLDVNTAGSYTVSLMNVCGITPSPDTITVVVYAIPVVSYSQTPDLMCLDWGNVLLDGGMPAGGDYSGPGVSNGEINTVLAGIGNHIITYSYTDTNNCVASDTSMVIIDACTNIPESDRSFTGIFPNPASDEFYVFCHDFGSISEMQIYCVRGSLVCEISVPGSSYEPVSIRLLPSGMYIVKFLFKDGSNSRHKLLKQ